jgi:hypothetical protein
MIIRWNLVVLLVDIFSLIGVRGLKIFYAR